MKLKIYILLTITFIARLASAQSEWTFKTQSDGIKVYSDTKSALKVKPIKVECTFNATPAQIAAVLLDIKNYPDWAYKTKQATIVKQVSATELFYYAEITMPWPAQNRDFAAHVTVTQNPETKVITVDAPSVTGLVPEKAGITRVRKSNGKWVLTPVGNNQASVTYYLQIEPDGGAPAWLINLFISDGPMQSFKKIKQQVQKPAYKNAPLLFAR
ncbi:START domain-containing protein [Mucilaginibacter sp. UR6-11]|uniref:START domain-containing protein n=1 Tax=Mucilaginibacter sp. UR6-11 TaxID=1435644 RepID=UPI001E56137E|nr:START domain-containing protein [Mucilaginibacter sp. UR6-11]MCC8423736.1 lipid-binding protein [Mucilaginibacter sp. UR6-11]